MLCIHSFFRSTARASVLVLFVLSANNSVRAQRSHTGSQITASDAGKMLDHHNEVRKEVGVGPVRWDVELAAYAQRWAEHLAKNNQCRMQHRNGSQREGEHYGENIFWGSSAQAFSPLDASISWYSEKEKYRYAEVNENNWYPTGHYTQMVWRNTTSMGAGMAVCPSGALIVVANYNPPGNYIGQYPY